MFSKVLVSNRGEIAVRAFRAATELGAKTVAVFPYEDRKSEHVLKADEAYEIGEAGHPVRAYLDPEGIVRTAVEAGADAVYPGYGFLSENPDLAEACTAAGVTFVGPPASVLHLTGNKARAIAAAKKAGLPTLRSAAPSTDVEELVKGAEEIGFPVFAKAVAGGGGRGMRRVERREDLRDSLEACMREAESAFGDATVFLEEAVVSPRHIEVQILADGEGNVIHLFERDCSVQRRHQKLIEESPAPAVDPELRERIGKIGTEAARAVGYRSAGTIEGLLQDGDYYFLEMNTRVQVEHCVTEMVTGIDIVREQLKIAAGEPLGYTQEDVVLRGHAIECRINAEDASKNFAPAPGRIASYREPAGPFVRVDSGAEAGYEVLPLYDPMIAKLIVWDVDREASTARMLRALSEYEIGGLKTLIPFHRTLLATQQWRNGETCRDLVEDKEWLKQLAFGAPPPAEEPAEQSVEREYAVEVSGRKFDVKVIGPPSAPNGAVPAGAVKQAPRRERKSGGGGGGAPGQLVSPIQGTVLKVAVEKGATVEEGALICVIEAMKMENEITAPSAGTVEELGVSEGGSIATGDTIAVIK